MAFLTDLWLPIILTSVALFFCSFLFWAILPHHKDDYSAAPDEEAMRSAVRSLGLPPGRYMFPNCKDSKGMKDPELQRKMEEGPMGMLNIWPVPNMGKNMALTFLTFLAATKLIAYLARETIPNGAEFARVFQVVGTAGVLTWCFSFIANMIWFNGGARAIVMCIIDGLVYGLVTGAIFAFLWPAATTGLPNLPIGQ